MQTTGVSALFHTSVGVLPLAGLLLRGRAR